MAKTVIDYLEKTARDYPEKEAFVDKSRSISFRELREDACKLCIELSNRGITHKPILIYLEKSVEAIVAFIGVAYSGNFYSPIDTKMPQSRIEKIIETLDPALVITDKEHIIEATTFCGNKPVVSIEELLSNKEFKYEDALSVASTVIDTDVLYVLFTSGSTGIPKGVIISHRAVVDYTDWITKTYNFDTATIFGNQAQLYFDLSIQDVYVPLKVGAKTVLIPNRMFVQPVRVWKTILENHVNTIVWIPSMLTLFANLDILANVEMAEISNVLFCGEVMPVKQLNYWIKHYPKATFANLYGPTECTDACTYYTITRHFNDDEVLPMGKACENSQVFLIDEQGRQITEKNIIGELYVRGSCLSNGYYNNREKTDEVFVQNPLNNKYTEIVYKTGDLVRLNENNELVYVSRKDFQIKHRGYRIELGEIDAAATSIPGIEYGCCVFDAKRDLLILIYKGEVEPEDVRSNLETKLQEYMVPAEYYKRENMLFNINGKIDRKALEKEYCI